jgi:uncharacterized SAM-binding protein YcdF (DUF218 family)
MLKGILVAAATPPGLCLLLLLAGLCLRRRWPRTGLGLLIAGVAALWLLSTPFVAGAMLRTLQTEPALPPTGPLPAAQAIVVLSAEADGEAAEYGTSTPGAMTLQRVRYAAALHKRTGLPVLTSGGIPGPGVEPLASSMARTLEQELGTPVHWREDRSRDTWENAAFSAELLKRDGIGRVLLVTHAWHLPRAKRCFERQGLQVVPAPTAFRAPAWTHPGCLVPGPGGLRDSYLALHEWYGLLAYALYD